MTIRKRILKFLDYQDISKYKFYKITGFSNGFLDKNGAIGSDKCEIICFHFKELNPEWLITGKGNMIKGLGEVTDVDVSTPHTENHSVTLLIEKIVELTTELAVLKNENILYRSNALMNTTSRHYPISDENLQHDIVAEPKDEYFDSTK